MASWCPNCGRQTSEGEKFCRQCGMPQYLKGDEAAEWILSTQKQQGTRTEPPFTQGVNASPTSPNSQTGPAYLPPQSFNMPPMPPAYYPPAQAGTSNIRLGDWLSGGWKIYSQNWLLMSIATLLAWGLGFATVGVLAGPMLMGLFRMAFKTMRQERPEISDLFNWQGRFWPAFLAFAIFGLIHLGATGLFSNGGLSGLISLAAGPFLTLMTGLTMSYLLERNADVGNALNEVGRAIFSRDAMMWWVVGLVFVTISIAGVAGCGIGVFVTMPWMISSVALAYRDVFGIDDPNRTNQ
ncbi:MAG: zinc-ribbon domain-containing protein [Blastocatellia bacterium]